MSATAWGVVVSAPDSAGVGRVLLGDETRRVWFNPLTFADPWPIPAPDDRVAVDVTPAGGREMHAIAVIGRGSPTYEFTP